MTSILLEKIKELLLTDEEFIRNVNENNINKCKLFIELGANVNAVDKSKNHILTIALLKKSYELANLLIDNGSDVNGATYYNYTSLMDVIRNKNMDLAYKLINKGADINATRNDNKTTVLMFACKYGNIELVKLILKTCTNIDALDNYAQSALSIAIYENNYDLAKLLIDNGANIHTMNDCDDRAMYIRNLKTLLTIAVEVSNIEIIKLLIEKGIDINASDSEALFFSVDKIDIMKLLLDNGCSMNKPYKNYDKTPLMHAIHTKNYDTANLLVDRGADLNIVINDKNILYYLYENKFNCDDDKFFVKHVELIYKVISKGVLLTCKYKNDPNDEIYGCLFYEWAKQKKINEIMKLTESYKKMTKIQSLCKCIIAFN
jgi:ankyrin repeat protein